MTDIPKSIVAAADALRSGELTSVALTEEFLSRAHAANDVLGAFIEIADETALAAARQADADLAAGIDKGPLQGIPLGIKDIIATVEAPTTANSRVMDPAWGAGRDATQEQSHTEWFVKAEHSGKPHCGKGRQQEIRQQGEHDQPAVSQWGKNLAEGETQSNGQCARYDEHHD